MSFFLATLECVLLGPVRVLEDGGQAHEVGMIAGERAIFFSFFLALIAR